MRLLQRTIISYLVYAVLIVAAAVLVFYFVMRNMVYNDVDKALYRQQEQLLYLLNSDTTFHIRDGWEDVAGNLIIIPGWKARDREGIYNIELYNKLARNRLKYRELSANVNIHDYPYHLILRMSLVDSEGFDKGVILTQVYLLIALIIGLILLSWFQSKRLWKPFYNTVSQLRQFQLDKSPELQLDCSSVREFRDLNKAITQLIDKNYRVYLQQKAFTENAAHEIQTPLAICQTKLDLLLQHKDLNREQATIIESLVSATHRLSRLNRDLLLLAKIENRQFDVAEHLQVSALLEEITAQFAEQVATKKIALQITSDKSFYLCINRTLLEMLISNLMSNAVKHNVQKGRINIAATKGKISFRNTGDPASLDESRIFDRFHKGRKNRSGAGLGLAIVKQVCTVSGFEIHYSFDDGLHTFSVVC